MSLDTARKYLVNKRPQHVPSASNLAKSYGTNVPSTVRLLKQLGYEQASDNSGWHLTRTEKIVHPIYVSKERVEKLKASKNPNKSEDDLIREFTDYLVSDQCSYSGILLRAIALYAMHVDEEYHLD